MKGGGGQNKKGRWREVGLGKREEEKRRGEKG